MRKYFIFAAAGAGLLFAGCDSISGDHRSRVIPVDDIPFEQTENEPVKKTVEPVARPAEVRVPEKKHTPPPAPEPQYQPMTGVKSSGGVDSPAGSKKQPARTAVQTAPGKEGVHIIQKGDTPDRIARKYKVRLTDLMKANNLNEESAKKLQVGKKLLIPAGKTPAASAPRKAAPAAVENGKYRVQKGDTPDRIARKHKVKLQDLLKVNGLNDESARRLQVNQLLTIPGAAVAGSKPAVDKPVQQTTTVNKPAVKQTVNQTPAAQSTNVKDIDQYEQKIFVATEDTTFAALAQKYGITEAQLRYINGGMSGDHISMGEEIIVPVK